MIYTVHHTKIGIIRMTLKWIGGASWDIVRCACRKEAHAVVAHLFTLDPGQPEFTTQANDRLAKIGMTIKALT